VAPPAVLTRVVGQGLEGRTWAVVDDGALNVGGVAPAAAGADFHVVQHDSLAPELAGDEGVVLHAVGVGQRDEFDEHVRRLQVLDEHELLPAFPVFAVAAQIARVLHPDELARRAAGRRRVEPAKRRQENV